MSNEVEALKEGFRLVSAFFHWIFYAPSDEIWGFVQRIVAYFLMFITFRWLWRWAFGPWKKQ